MILEKDKLKAQTRTRTHTRMPARSRTYARMRACTHARMHARRRTRTRTISDKVGARCGTEAFSFQFALQSSSRPRAQTHKLSSTDGCDSNLPRLETCWAPPSRRQEGQAGVSELWCTSVGRGLGPVNPVNPKCPPRFEAQILSPKAVAQEFTPKRSQKYRVIWKSLRRLH